MQADNLGDAPADQLHEEYTTDEDQDDDGRGSFDDDDDSGCSMSSDDSEELEVMQLLMENIQEAKKQNQELKELLINAKKGKMDHSQPDIVNAIFAQRQQQQQNGDQKPPGKDTSPK
jgi:hypothetical protein